MNVVDMPATEKDEPANVLQLEAGNGGQRTTRSTWRKRLSRSKKDGGIKSTLANATVILAHDPTWKGVLGYDQRAEQPILLSHPPFTDVPPALRVAPRELKDGDDVRTIQWLEEHYGVTVTLPNVHAAINAVAEMHPFDRVREYLEARVWDGEQRLTRWAVTYLGAEDTAYTEAVGRRWKISCVARTFDPGCKADHVLVLEGPQGIGKSTALKTLAGADYFADDVPPIGGKDAQQYLGALWIVELAEMDAATRAEASTLKRFLTTTTDRYRPPYGRRMIPHPRRCIFAGSVNLQEYLRDSTGGRRFWPLKCGHIDLEGLARDRDQLWAEAFAAYRSGEAWHLDDATLVVGAQAQQEQRLESDPWEAAIRRYLTNPTRTFVTTAELLTDAVEMKLERATKRDSNRVGGVLRGMGWEYGEGEARQRGWFRPAQAVRP